MMYPQKKLLKHAFKSFKHTRSLYTFHVRNSPLLGSVLPMAIVLRGAHESMHLGMSHDKCQELFWKQFAKCLQSSKKMQKKRTQMHENKRIMSPLRFKKTDAPLPEPFCHGVSTGVAHRTVNKGAGLPWLDPWEDMHISQETMRDETLTIHWGMIMTWNNGYLLVVLKKKYVLPFLLQSVVKGCLIDPNSWQTWRWLRFFARQIDIPSGNQTWQSKISWWMMFPA